MFKRSLGAALLLACTLPHALAQMVTITAAHLSAGGQAAISNATISFTPVLSTGQVASYRIGTTGGQSTITPIAAQVTNGAFSTTIPDTTRTAPVNLCFRRVGVSIHAPLAGRDSRISLATSCRSGFQSTRPLRGATIFLIPASDPSRVSIHAPLAGRDSASLLSCCC